MAMRGLWQRYWFRAGGRYAAAALRIAIGASVLLTLWRLRDGHAGLPEAAPDEQYSPIGILKLIPFRPGEGAFAVVWGVAWASTLAMIAGAWSRAATAVSFVAALVIASYEYSFSPTWSHDCNAPLLAQLAFLGARGGDAWSIDAWRRRRRGVAPPGEHPYLWSVLLVQLAIGLMMANAAYYKLLSGGTSLSWVFSDNLRNHVLVRFDLQGVPRTGIADWLIEEPARWKTAALLNIIAQLAPLGACFATRRPLLRAALGGLFALETIGLDLVMGFPNHHWLPLTAAFIDWDRLVARLRRAPAPAAAIVRPGRAARAFLIAFVVADVVIAFWRWPKIDQKLSAYPLSGFPMFAAVRALPPYGEHRPYETFETRFEVEVEAPTPLPAEARDWIAYHRWARRLQNVRTADGMRERLVGFSAELRARFPALAVRSVRATLVAVQMAPYPRPPGVERVPVATLGELAGQGGGAVFRSMLSRVERAGAVTPSPTGLPAPVGLGYYEGGRVAPLAGPPPRRRFVLARVPVPGESERWFVVGERR